MPKSNSLTTPQDKFAADADALPPATPQTLADQIADQLGWKIALRKILPGERIREVELARKYNVSRPLVREVLQRLEVQGLIEIVPWKGARVPVLTATQLSDLFEFASLAFGFVCRLAATRATETQLSLVASAIERLERMAATNCTAEEYERGRMMCHQLLEGCLGETNELMRTRPVVRRTRHQFSIDSTITPELRRISAKRWRTLLDHLEARDATAAEAHARSMVLATRDVGLEAHRRSDTASAGT